MKTLEWQKFFAEQKELHGKVVFSVAELANAAQTPPHAVNTELGRLLARGVVSRYAQGRYGPAAGAAPEQVLSAIDPGAYITSFYALHRHNLVTQLPSQITCFTNRRHNRTSRRTAPTWQLHFVCVPSRIYFKPAEGNIAAEEQALCDFVWLNLRDGIEPLHLVTFMNLERLNLRRLRRVLQHYSAKVRNVVERITASN